MLRLFIFFGICAVVTTLPTQLKRNTREQAHRSPHQTTDIGHHSGHAIHKPDLVDHSSKSLDDLELSHTHVVSSDHDNELTMKHAIVAPKVAYIVSITELNGHADHSGFIKEILDMLLKNRLVDTRFTKYAGYILSKLGRKFKSLASAFGLFHLTPSFSFAKVPSIFQDIDIPGHATEKAKMLSALRMVNDGKAKVDTFVTALLELVLNSGAIELQKVEELAASYNIQVSTVKHKRPPPETVSLSSVVFTNAKMEEMPPFITKLLDILVEKEIFTIKTASNVLTTFGIEATGQFKKYIGKPISSPANIKINGKPLHNLKFIHLFMKLVINKAAAKDTLPELAKILMELAVDNDAMTVDEAEKFRSTDFKVTVDHVQKPDDDSIFDLPDSNPDEEPEPDPGETGSEPESDPSISVDPDLPQKPVVPSAEAVPESVIPEQNSVHILEQKTHLDISYIVTAYRSKRADNSALINELLSTIVDKGVFDDNLANSILASYNIAGGDRFSRDATPLTSDSIQGLKIKGNAEAATKLLDSLKGYRNEKDANNDKPNNFASLQLIKALLELILDNKLMQWQEAADQAVKKGVSIRIQSFKDTVHEADDDDDDDDDNSEKNTVHDNAKQGDIEGGIKSAITESHLVNSNLYSVAFSSFEKKQMPLYISEILNLLVQKRIIAYGTAANILATFASDIEVTGQFTNGKPISSTESIEITGTNFASQTKFISIFKKLISNKSSSATALSDIAKALLELAVNNEGITTEEAKTMSSKYDVVAKFSLDKQEDSHNSEHVTNMDGNVPADHASKTETAKSKSKHISRTEESSNNRLPQELGKELGRGSTGDLTKPIAEVEEPLLQESIHKAKKHPDHSQVLHSAQHSHTSGDVDSQSGVEGPTENSHHITSESSDDIKEQKSGSNTPQGSSHPHTEAEPDISKHSSELESLSPVQHAQTQHENTNHKHLSTEADTRSEEPSKRERGDEPTSLQHNQVQEQSHQLHGSKPSHHKSKQSPEIAQESDNEESQPALSAEHSHTLQRGPSLTVTGHSTKSKTPESNNPEDLEQEKPDEPKMASHPIHTADQSIETEKQKEKDQPSHTLEQGSNIEFSYYVTMSSSITDDISMIAIKLLEAVVKKHIFDASVAGSIAKNYGITGGETLSSGDAILLTQDSLQKLKINANDEAASMFLKSLENLLQITKDSGHDKPKNYISRQLIKIISELLLDNEFTTIFGSADSNNEISVHVKTVDEIQRLGCESTQTESEPVKHAEQEKSTRKGPSDYAQSGSSEIYVH